MRGSLRFTYGEHFEWKREGLIRSSLFGAACLRPADGPMVVGGYPTTASGLVPLLLLPPRLSFLRYGVHWGHDANWATLKGARGRTDGVYFYMLIYGPT